MTEGNLLTPVMGTYPQTEWLIDREDLTSTRVPRVCYQLVHPCLISANNHLTWLWLRKTRATLRSCYGDLLTRKNWPTDTIVS